jgi:putative membrane protein
MKTILRNSFIYGFALYFLPQIIPGVHLSGGLMTLVIGGIALTLLFMILKPILNIISFPVTLLTLGLFSIITNALILYLLTVFVPGVSIGAFTYPRSEVFGFITPKISLNMFFAYVYAAFVLSLIDSSVEWLMK